MYCKLALTTLVVILGNDFASAQEIPSTTTAAEMWNPWTWFWPYAIASAEGYRDYYQKAQKATNELYQQIYKTNAFPWITGNWGSPQSQPQPQPQPNQNGGQSNQGQNTEGEASGQPNSVQDNESTSQKPTEGETTQAGEKNEENQTEAEGTGAQVQGNVQGDGTAEAEVKPN